jgi:hypothetical protein
LESIGAAECVIYSIKTNVDGSVNITLNFNSTDTEIIKKLLDIKLSDNPLVYVGFSKES